MGQSRRKTRRSEQRTRGAAPGNSVWNTVPANGGLIRHPVWFKSAAGLGYNVVVIEYYLPYPTAFRNLLTYGYLVPMSSIARGALGFVPSGLLFPGHLRHARMFDEAFDRYLEQASRSPSNTFFYAHLNFPHEPYPYAEDGHLIGRAEFLKWRVAEGQQDNRRRYRASVVQLDRKIGALLDLLEREDKFDSSLIIVTSDHNAEYPSPQVPLLIKTPQQMESTSHRERADMFHTKSFVDEYLRSGNVKLQLLQ